MRYLLLLLLLGCGSLPEPRPDPMDADRCSTALGLDGRWLCLCRQAIRDTNRAQWDLFECEDRTALKWPH